MNQIITIENLEILSKTWDRRTVKTLVPREGSGNMFGGRETGVVVIIHGENSIDQTGNVEMEGEYLMTFNISRGENGSHSQTLTYTPTKGEPITINIGGSCGGAREALCSILSCKQDYLRK